jgi:hypothetical protein
MACAISRFSFFRIGIENERSLASNMTLILWSGNGLPSAGGRVPFSSLRFFVDGSVASSLRDPRSATLLRSPRTYFAISTKMGASLGLSPNREHQRQLTRAQIHKLTNGIMNPLG